MSIINGLPINVDNDKEHYEVLINRQARMIRNMILPKINDLFSTLSTVCGLVGGMVNHVPMTQWLAEVATTITTDPTQ